MTLENAGHDIYDDNQLVPTYFCDAYEESENEDKFISIDGIYSLVKSPKTTVWLLQRKKRREAWIK